MHTAYPMAKTDEPGDVRVQKEDAQLVKPISLAWQNFTVAESLPQDNVIS